MAEIVVAEPIRGADEAECSRPVTRYLTYGRDGNPEHFDSERLPIALAPHIRSLLRVANQIDAEEPRVAYICRFRAFEIAHEKDPNSLGRGVRQFKTLLLNRLQQDEDVSVDRRKELTDIREIERVYLHYKNYIRKYSGTNDLKIGYGYKEKLSGIASVLHEVLVTYREAADTQGLDVKEGIDGKSTSFAPYNILPLNTCSANLEIMQLPEIKAAIAVVQNIHGLPSMEEFNNDRAVLDLFEWLGCCFGFQEGNVANQREHLVLLLSNTYIRQPHKESRIFKLRDGAVDELMKKFFKNYRSWCRFLGRKHNIRLPAVKREAQQYKLLYIGLYLLIWGEAANLRFMPECLCYIFHQMACDLHGIVSWTISMTTWERVRSAYGRGRESFLENVVNPIYRVIYEEAEKSKTTTDDHGKWRNYDDLNEFFWSPDCFEIGWPLRLEHDFFYVPPFRGHSVSNPAVSVDTTEGDGGREGNGDEEMGLDYSTLDTYVKWQSCMNATFCSWLKRSLDVLFFKARATKDGAHANRWLGKTNFVEIRSFLHIFRSFDRMWTFLIVSLQASIIMACHDLGSPIQMFDSKIFEDVISIFITSAALKLIQAILDIVFSWKARHMMDASRTLKLLLKLIVAVLWTIILPVFYFTSKRKYSCQSTYNFGWPGEWCLSSYVVAVTIYLMTNAIQMVLYFVPAISRYLETSNHWICKILSWWTEPRLYVGRGMQESQVSLFKYTFFWLLLLLSKLTFSYSFEIKPLISPTRKIMKIGVKKYDWHELFPKVKNNAGAISAVWAPVILVYFMDLQIWYSVYCALFGGVCGIFHHLGEIRTLGMLRSRFHSLPAAFSNSLIPPASRKGQGKHKSYFYKKFQKVSENKKNGVAAFILVWNQIIKTFRSEDLINNRELDLMTIPSSNLSAGMIRWPVFLLANELSRALCIAKDFVGKDADLFKKIKKDKCMICAVMECYESLKYILDILVLGELDKRIVSYIITEIEESVARSSFLENFKMTAIPALADKCTELAEHLIKRNEDNLHVVTRILQDIFELVTNDIMTNGSRILDLLYSQQPEGGNNVFSRNSEPPLFLSISYPLPISLNEQIKRFYLLLSVKDTAMDIPANLEARRRISFFATSLFMDMPNAPNVQNMLSFSVMTPYYMEEVKFSWEELSSSQEGVSIIYYMQKIYPDEWNNFLERMGCEDMDGSETKQKDGELRYRANPQEKISSADEWKSCLKDVGCENSDGKVDELRNWASFRGQTLSRTVRGMMYLRKAIRLQAFLDVPKNEEIFKGYDAVEGGNDMLSAQLDAIADMKFTYVISCQNFGSQKSLLDPKVDDIVDLMKRYPSLRVAYVEEKEESVGQKVYTSILLKAASDYSQEIYRIKLPGPPNIGEGKPENQNNAIIFTRGEALQTIDMNQDNYMEEAFKMRNLLQEFVKNQRWRPPTILGLREHVFTGSISSLAWFMSYQETSFVTIGQRLLANPLRVRFHYGHPDIFDRIFHITRGGISKASKTINLSEDVFAGFNSTLRRGHVTYHEYLQVGKGRDVGLNQISRFEAKVSNGNSEQTLSRDIYRLGHQFDFFRMLSCYFTTIGFYFNSLIAVIGIYIFLYGQLYLVLSGLAKALLEAKMQNIQSIETALASQSFIQLGLLTGLPMVVELTLEKGFLAAVEDFILMQLQLAAVFFTFTLGTKSHYYGRTILHGGAKYRPTGRKVVVFHASFTENYRLYSRSHFVKGFELLLLLIVYDFYRRSYQGSMAYVLITYSIWFLSLTWLFAPFLFNPSGFNWGKIMGDWKDWNKWIGEQGGIGISQSKSWESWWNDEQAHLRHSGLVGRLIEAMLSLRFFIYQYGVVYHLDISRQNKDFLVYAFSWTVILAVFLLVQAVNAGRYLFSENFHFVFRLFKAALFLGIVATIVILSFACQMSLKDLIVGSLAFLPTGWGLIMIAQTLRPVVERVGLWDFTTVLVRAYDYGMGVVLFAPVAVLAWMPIISAFQTRFLFNEAFNRHLQIQRILSGKEKHR